MATASGISPDLEQKIKQNTLYSDLPPSIKEVQRSVGSFTYTEHASI